MRFVVVGEEAGCVFGEVFVCELSEGALDVGSDVCLGHRFFLCISIK